MSNDVDKMLEERIELLLEQLNNVELGSKEHAAILRELTILESKRNERYKIDVDYYINEEKRKDNVDAEKNKLYADLAKAAVFTASWVFMSLKVMKFEETGTIRSKAWPNLPKIFK